MKLRSVLFLALFMALATSCMSLALSFMGIYKTEAKVATYTDGEKTVAYIPMKHIGPKEFYAGVKHKVDSLQALGYIVFMESVKVIDSLTPAQQDTLRLKLRKLSGVAIRKEGYLDTINHKLMGRNFKNKRGLINQPKYSLLGVDTTTGRIVDVPMNVLIKQYEKQYGPIVLDPCDYTTPMEEKYKCDKEKNSRANEMILQFRNQHLADAIIAEKHNKIAVLYGAAHESGLFTYLVQASGKWQQVRDKSK
jgi:hypothetical protein